MTALSFRPAHASDAKDCVRLRGLTRENAFSEQELAALGITPESWAERVAAGQLAGRICRDEARMVGYCFGDRDTGEILVLALLPDYEHRGIGKTLLSQVVEELRVLGHARLFLGCSRDASHRSHGFYRHLGWTPDGTSDAHGDEVLELRWPGRVDGA